MNLGPEIWFSGNAVGDIESIILETESGLITRPNSIFNFPGSKASKATNPWYHVCGQNVPPLQFLPFSTLSHQS